MKLKIKCDECDTYIMFTKNDVKNGVYCKPGDTFEYTDSETKQSDKWYSSKWYKRYITVLCEVLEKRIYKQVTCPICKTKNWLKNGDQLRNIESDGWWLREKNEIKVKIINKRYSEWYRDY